MKRLVFGLVGLASMAAASVPASAQDLEAALRYVPSLSSSAFMRVYGPAQPPYGFVRFCEVETKACSREGAINSRFEPTVERLSELDEINRMINREIAPATDLEVYGVSEYWTLPVSRGDCEDYALLKQRVLLERGWPKSALLLTVVRDEKGEGHAVLTVRTSQGDYMLDNKVDEVLLWNKTGYQLVMRQSYIDPRVWVSLDAASRTAPDALAGVGNSQ